MTLRTTIVLLTMLGAASAARDSQTSDRYGFSTFREESGRLTVLVDGYPASVAEATAYVPIPVVVAMTKPGKHVTFTPESFTLVDAKGNAVPAAGYEELTKKYDRLTFDRSLLRERPIAIGNYIADLRQVEARFYPPGNEGTRIARVELAPNTWFTDVLYFPRPPAGLNGVVTLRVALPDESPVEVRFVASEKDLASR
jgi:hypothetical protein